MRTEHTDRQQEFYPSTAPMDLVRAWFPSVLLHYPSLASLPEAPPSSVNEDPDGALSSNASPDSLDRLRADLSRLNIVLATEPLSRLPLAPDVARSLFADRMHMAWVTWRGLWLTLELSTHNDMEDAVARTFGYMRQHRMTQPFMRFILGLAATETAMTLIRADGVGVELCTLEMETPRGVMEVVRLALGLAVADHAHRGGTSGV